MSPRPGSALSLTPQARPDRAPGAPGPDTFLLHLADRLRLEETPDGILLATAEALGRRLGVNRVGYGEVNEAENYVDVACDWTDGVASVKGRMAYLPEASMVQAYRRGETVVTTDALADEAPGSPAYQAMAEMQIIGSITVPLIRQGRLVALVSVQQATPRVWSESEVQLVQAVADRTWATLEHARTAARLRESQEDTRRQLAARQRDQDFLLGWSDAVREETDPLAILRRTVDRLGEHLGVSRVNYAQADASGERLIVESDWTSGAPSVAGGVFPLVALGAAVVADHLTGAPFRTDDLHADRRFGGDNRATYDQVEVRAFVSVPLVKSGALIAVLSVQQREPRIWTDAEVRLLQDVAERTWSILERARSEARLRESEALLAAFMENAPVGMYLKDDAGRYTRVNREMARALGLRPEQALGRTAVELIGPEHGGQIEALDRLALAGEAQSTELTLGEREAYGSALVIRFPIHVEGGAPVGIGGFAIDVTARRRAEAALERSREALFQSEKLTALGSLLAGVSHELNNPLSIVVAQSVMMERRAEGGELAERAVKIRKAADRCARIVQTFLAMARQKRPERDQADLNAIVVAALDLTDYGLRTAGVQVERDFAPALPPLLADADQLHQVVVNLILNAQQALAEQAGPRVMRVRTRATDNHLVLEISDNGPGVPSELGRRIFEPFFTTKPQGAGTGVGLSFSQGLVEAHGGLLELVEGGVGATFRVTLPVEDTTAPDPVVVARPAGLDDRPRTALVVDDEPELGEALADFLGLEGFVCDVARGGREAQRRLADSHYDLVVSDLRMPDLDGPTLYAWIKQERPELADRTAFATGDMLSASAARFLARENRPLLEKPFTPEALRRLLDEMDAST